MSDKNKKEEKLFEAPIKPKGEEKINEFSLSWSGRLLFAGAAAFILGKGMNKMNLPIKIRGNPQQIKAIVDAIVSSKKFQQELNRSGATIDSVINKMQIRNLSKSQFYNITGKNWPI